MPLAAGVMLELTAPSEEVRFKVSAFAVVSPIGIVVVAPGVHVG